MTRFYFHFFSFVFFWWTGPGAAYGQVQSRLIRSEAEIGSFIGSAGVTPLWLRANQAGMVPRTAPTATLRFSLMKAYRSDSSRRGRIDWGFGVNPVVNAGTTAQVLLVEGYAKVRWRGVELAGGRRRERVGLGDSVLSSGFLSGADNALPIPKVSLQTLGFRSLPILNRFVALSAGVSHGWFQADYIRGVFLHQKHLYLRLGKPDAHVHGYAGINHQALWGGQADFLREPPIGAPGGKLPASLRDFPYVFLAAVPKDWYLRGYTSFDSYRVGNHLGTADFGLSLRAKGGRWQLYHQHLFEDVSGLLFLNAPDGLWGLNWTRSSVGRRSFQLNRITLEGLSTTNQSGPTFYITDSRYQGADNYFNHGQYIRGWSYRGNAIGTPLIPPRTEVVPGLQVQSDLYFPANRVQSAYLAASGQWAQWLSFSSRLSYGRYYGTFYLPFSRPVSQFSGLFSAQLSRPAWRGLGFTAALALDAGRLLPRSVGGYLGLQKRWL